MCRETCDECQKTGRVKAPMVHHSEGDPGKQFILVICDYAMSIDAVHVAAEELLV